MIIHVVAPAASTLVPVPIVPASYRRPGHCVVCQAPLRASPRIEADPYPACHAIACRMVVSRRAAMGEAGFRRYLDVQVRQAQRQAALAAASRARHQAEAGENAAAWASLRARFPVAQAGEALHLLLPSGPRHARRPPAARLEHYRTHLLKIAAEAAAMAPAAQPEYTCAPSAGASSMPGRLCALCGGGCCTRGGEHAYLSAPTLRRVMDAQPELSTHEVVAAYLDRVALKTQAGSCINHTRHGCSLPREMRSDTCNRFACESLARLQAAQRGAQPVQVVLVVRRKQDQWRRSQPDLDNAVNGGAVLRETGTRRMPVASLRAPAPAE